MHRKIAEKESTLKDMLNWEVLLDELVIDLELRLPHLIDVVTKVLCKKWQERRVRRRRRKRRRNS